MAKTRNAQKTAPKIDASHAHIIHPAATPNSKTSAKSGAQSQTNTTAKTKKRSNTRSGAKQNQREQIITVANRLFREKGYHKTSVSEIAHEVGMDQSSIYYWFPSKEAILEQVCDPNRSLSALDHIMNDIDDRVVQLYMLISYDVVRLSLIHISPDAIHGGSEEQAHGLIHNRYTGIYRLLINYIYKSIHVTPKIDTFGRPIDLSGHKEIVHDELW